MSAHKSLDHCWPVGRSGPRVSLLAIGVLIGFMPSVEVFGSQQSATERNRQIVTAAFDHWAAGGNTFFADVLAPDIVWTIEGSGPSAGRFHGRDVFIERAVRPFVSRLSSPIRPVAKTVWADGEHVIVNWKGEGVARDGAAYRNSYVWIFRMQDGKAVEATAFLDLAPYDDVLRRIPEPAVEGR